MTNTSKRCPYLLHLCSVASSNFMKFIVIAENGMLTIELLSTAKIHNLSLKEHLLHVYTPPVLILPQ